MIGIFDGITKLGATLIDNLFETETEKAEAKAKLLKLKQDGALKSMEQYLSVMLAEAKSADPWTSRARPSFLYVIYIFILAAIPIGVIYSFASTVTRDVIKGASEWLNSIPESMWTLFGIGYLGYAGACFFDKNRILSNKTK